VPGSSEARDAAAAVPSGRRVVIQLARLGDFLQTTPLLACLRRDCPGQPLALVVTPAQAPLARHCEMAHELIILDPATLVALADRRGAPAAVRRAVLGDLLTPAWSVPAEEVINLNLSKLSALVAAGWRGAKRRGWRLSDRRQLVGEAFAGFITAMVAQRRLTRLHLCDILVSYADPPRPARRRLVYRVRQPERQAAEGLIPAGGGPLVVLQLGANNDLRRWPVDSFAELARGLLDAGARVVLVGSSAERPLARRLAGALGPAAEAVADLLGRTSLEHLAAVLSAGDLVISGDTGTLHLATAVGARTLSLFMGPAQAHETGPYAPGHLVLQARDDCGPCWEESPACGGQAPCRRLITPRAALAAALGLLGGGRAEAVARELDVPAAVEALAAVADDFGLRYRPLRPRPLTAQDALALVLREVGRQTLRSAYHSTAADIAAEAARDFAPPSFDTAARINELARAMDELQKAQRQSDPAGVQAVLAKEPALGPLALATVAGQWGRWLRALGAGAKPQGPAGAKSGS